MSENKNKDCTYTQKQTEQQQQTNYYQSQNSKRVRNLLQILKEKQSPYINNQKKQIIFMKRKCKHQAIKRKFRNIQLQSIKPPNANSRIFSYLQPLATGDPYLDIKQKSATILSDRVFTKKPNIISGQSCRKQEIGHSQHQKRDYLSRKFHDYDETVSQQTGPMRILLKRRQMISKNIQSKPQICINSTNCLFSTFEGSKNQFYDLKDNPQKISKLDNLILNSRNSLQNKRYSRRVATLGSLHTDKTQILNKNKFNVLKLSKNPSMNSEIGSYIEHRQNYRFKTDTH